MALSPTTRLDAVNTILGSAGESAVTSLDNAPADVGNALNVLDEVTRDVLLEGWYFNVEDGVAFQPAVDNTITVPPSVLTFDSEPDGTVDPILRGQRVYDRKSHSYSFTKPVTARVTYLLEWADLPQAARHYIAVRSARVYCDRFVGADSIHGFSTQDEQMARARMMAANNRDADPNIFNSPEMALKRWRR